MLSGVIPAKAGIQFSRPSALLDHFALESELFYKSTEELRPLRIPSHDKHSIVLMLWVVPFFLLDHKVELNYNAFRKVK